MTYQRTVCLKRGEIPNHENPAFFFFFSITYFKTNKQNQRNTQVVLCPQVAGSIGNFNELISFTAARLSWSLYLQQAQFYQKYAGFILQI